MDLEVAFIIATVGYLLGSFSFARIFLRLLNSKMKIEDLRMELEGSDKMTRVGVYGANAYRCVAEH